MAGVFFHTAPLHHELYCSYVPVRALGPYRRRRLARPQAGANEEVIAGPAPKRVAESIG
jgi:hypothetical protein